MVGLAASVLDPPFAVITPSTTLVPVVPLDAVAYLHHIYPSTIPKWSTQITLESHWIGAVRDTPRLEARLGVYTTVSSDAQLRSAIADGIVPVSPAALIVIWHAEAPTGQCLVQDHSSVPPAHSLDLLTSHANVIESSRTTACCTPHGGTAAPAVGARCTGAFHC